MCLIVDVFSRRIVRWRIAAHMRHAMVLDALEVARWSRGTYLASSSGRNATSNFLKGVQSCGPAFHAHHD